MKDRDVLRGLNIEYKKLYRTLFSMLQAIKTIVKVMGTRE